MTQANQQQLPVGGHRPEARSGAPTKGAPALQALGPDSIDRPPTGCGLGLENKLSPPGVTFTLNQYRFTHLL